MTSRLPRIGGERRHEVPMAMSKQRLPQKGQTARFNYMAASI